MGEFYGSGVYFIYYNGDYRLYEPLRGTETPIYVGQAAPANENARTPAEQGLRLAARLNEHRKNIERADSLRIGDFECRALVVQTGWGTGAEDYLIRLFRPIWNSETKLVFGLGKHGDSADTRRNKRSPWDTLHAGREWAGAVALTDAKSPEKIAEELTAHFARIKIYDTLMPCSRPSSKTCGRLATSSTGAALRRRLHSVMMMPPLTVILDLPDK